MGLVQPSNVLLSLTISFALSFILIAENQAFGIEFTNYTSEEHGIQFQYPTGWKINEKT